jgi:hypothetical protein
VQGQFLIIACDNVNFSEFADRLITKSNCNPIYSSLFNSYYSEVSGKKSENKSVIVASNNEPILGLLYSASNTTNQDTKIEYFGLPAVLLSSLESEIELLEIATKTLRNYLSESRKNLFFGKNTAISGSITINNQKIFQTSFCEEIISSFKKSQARFNRVIDLKIGMDQIKKEYSKSVRSAVNSYLNSPNIIEIVDFTCSEESQSFAVNSLKNLHTNSAGRMTRSEQSWIIQELNLSMGNAFIVQLKNQDAVISSAYFMKTKFDCYYGISASQLKSKGGSYSHLCVAEAISYCEKRNLNTFHLGEQLSNFSHEVTEKERNIEKFKSFFGGVLHSEIHFLK